MKTILLILYLWCLASSGFAQTQEIQQLLLNVEKLNQFKQILRDMKKGYTLLSGGYQTIKDISRGDFNLHQVFLDGLLQVSPAVRNYHRVVAIGQQQLQLVKVSQQTYQRFRQSGHFNPRELKYLGEVYERLVKKSMENLDDLLLVLTTGKLRMSDDERLKEIDRIFLDIQDQLSFLSAFNEQTSLLALQRKQEKQNELHMQTMYGLDQQ